MNRLFLLLGLGLLSFSVACGRGGSSNQGFGSGGNTANSKLSGQYTYELSGIDLTTSPALFFREAGVFTADGNGHITAGFDDTAEGSSVALNAPVTGTYSISTDGTGSAALTFSNNSVLTLALTVIGSSKVNLIEVDSGVTAGGTAELQSTSSFSAAPSGTFAFRFHSFGPASVAEVGAFTVTSGAISGTADVNRSGALTSGVAVTGLFNAPDATSGRGTGTLNDPVNGTTSFSYYMIDSNTAELFSTLPGVVGLGRAEKQTVTSFSTASLSGGYAFGSRGDSLAGSGDDARTVGRFSANGGGTITGGVFDSAEDGVASSNVSFTGTYTVDSDGRAALTLAPASNIILWMISPSRAFFLMNETASVEDGTVDLQSGSFSNSSLSGTYSFLTDGFTATNTYDRVGLITADGSGGIGLKYILNLTGVTSSTPVTLHGSYSADASGNGRVTGSVDTLSSNLVFYMVSGSQAYILQNDAGTEIDGSMSKQQ